MCTLYYFYFLSSRVIQLTPYFMILLVLIFIVNRNFKLLNWHSILLLFFFVLLPLCFLYSFYIIIVCVIAVIVIYLLLLLFTHLFTYLFIHIYYIIYLFCGLDLYKVRPFTSSPHIRFTTVYIAYLWNL